MQSLQDLALMVSEKRPKQGNMSIISLEHVWKSNIVVYSWSTWCSQQSYKVSTYSYKDKQISVNLVWHCCDLRIQSRVLKWKCNEYYRHAKFDTYHTYSVRENCSIYVFATYQQLPSQPALQWSLNTHIFHVSKKFYYTTVSHNLTLSGFS